MLLNELQTMASSLGISGTAKMRKGDLIAAIEENQADSRVPRARAEAPTRGQVAALGDATRTEVRAEVRDDALSDSREVARDTDHAVGSRGPRRASRGGGPREPREDRVAPAERAERNGHTDRHAAGERNGSVERVERSERAERNGERDRGDRGERNG